MGIQLCAILMTVLSLLLLALEASASAMSVQGACSEDLALCGESAVPVGSIMIQQRQPQAMQHLLDDEDHEAGLRRLAEVARQHAAQKKEFVWKADMPNKSQGKDQVKQVEAAKADVQKYYSGKKEQKPKGFEAKSEEAKDLKNDEQNLAPKDVASSTKDNAPKQHEEAQQDAPKDNISVKSAAKDQQPAQQKESNGHDISKAPKETRRSKAKQSNEAKSELHEDESVNTNGKSKEAAVANTPFRMEARTKMQTFKIRIACIAVLMGLSLGFFSMGRG